jgi:cell division protein FtsZ
MEICDKEMRYKDALMKIDEMLANATRGILGIITEVGYVNTDFADVCTILKGKGDALIGTGLGSGKNRAADAIHNALNSPLLNGYSINGAKSILVNIYSGDDLLFGESEEILAEINKTAGDDLNLIKGIVLKPEMEGQMMVTILATDFYNPKKRKRFSLKRKRNENLRS